MPPKCSVCIDMVDEAVTRSTDITISVFLNEGRYSIDDAARANAEALTVIGDLRSLIIAEDLEDRIPADLLPDRRRRAQLAITVRRDEVIARDGYVCGICGGGVAPDQMSIDHIVPISRGGTDDLDNLQAAHRSCNSRKGAKRAA